MGYVGEIYTTYAQGESNQCLKSVLSNGNFV